MRMLLPEINKIVPNYKDTARFLFVYILEAHASNELTDEIPQHRNISDRLKVGTNFFMEHPVHPSFTLTVDNSDDGFVNLYCSWPFRYWMIQDGMIRLKCMPEGDSASLDALKDWLFRNIYINPSV